MSGYRNKTLDKVIVGDGIRRKSPRISALESTKENHQNRERTGSGIKRKFYTDAGLITSTSKLAKQVWKGRDSRNDEGQSIKHEWRAFHESQVVKDNTKRGDDSAITNGKVSAIPGKHILELVLDTLQRRDTYEIFAEPVDPDEVEDYHEIIKEPMDFGTMRAKLHEGMYTNLEQFEHDVFLIPENTMYFNSSVTVYFKQGRVIHELAKKVFHVLKTDPENFVLEFSGTRRRSMRKALCDDTNDSAKFPCSKKGETTKKTRKKNLGCKTTHNQFNPRNFLTGNRDGRFSGSEVVDRRSTYLRNEKDSIASTLFTSSPTLILMNQGDISYEDSLMSFVKDLGPIAQMVAKWKLLGQDGSISRIQPEKSMIYTASEKKSDNVNVMNPSKRKLLGQDGSFSKIQPEKSLFSTAPRKKSDNVDVLKISKTKLLGKDGSFSTIQPKKSLISPALQNKIDNMDNVNLNTNTAYRTFSDFASQSNPFLGIKKNIIDLTEEENQPSDRSRTPLSYPTLEKVNTGYDSQGKEKADPLFTLLNHERTFSYPIPEKVKISNDPQGKEKTDCPITLETQEHRFLKKYGITKTRKSTATTKDLILSTSFKETGKMDNLNAKPVILALENPHPSCSEFKLKKNQALASSGAVVEKEGCSSLAKAKEVCEPIMPMPIASQFTFDLPFLKARLNEMNVRREGFLRAGYQTESIGIKSFNYNQSLSRSSFDKLDTNLSLQL